MGMAVTRMLGGILVSTAIVISTANPVMATHDAEHAKQQIAQVVDDAVRDMAARVASFKAQLGTATTESEIEAMRKAARSDVGDIWADARSEVESLGKGYNSELSAEIAEAKQRLVAARNQAQAEIDDAAAAATRNLTESITTTTTTSPATTTTAPGTTTTSKAALPAGEDPPDPSTAATPPGTQTPLERWATQAFVTAQASSPSSSSSGAARSGLTVALETVLPQDLIDWAMSPFRILALIVRTTTSGGRSILLPAAALAIAAAVVVGLEARSRRVAASRR